MSRRPTAGDLGDALELGLEALERRQSLLERGMVREDVQERALGLRGDDEEGTEPFGLAEILSRLAFDRAGDLDQRRRQRAGPPGQHRRAAVGGELPAAGAGA